MSYSSKLQALRGQRNQVAGDLRRLVDEHPGEAWTSDCVAKYDAGLSGTMAMSQLDHARQGGSVVSAGLATYEGENALAVGVGKSWKLSGPNVNEVVLGVAGFVGSSNTTGAAASVGIHFGQKN